LKVLTVRVFLSFELLVLICFIPCRRPSTHRFLAGGSGITFALSSVQDLLHPASKLLSSSGSSRTPPALLLSCQRYRCSYRSPLENKRVLHPCANGQAAGVLRSGKRQSIRRVGAWAISVFSIASTATLFCRSIPIPAPLHPNTKPLLRAPIYPLPPWPNSCSWKAVLPQIV